MKTQFLSQILNMVCAQSFITCNLIRQNIILICISNILVFSRKSSIILIQVLVIHPESDNIRAAPRLCIFSLCEEESGSCSLFSDYQLTVLRLNPTASRSRPLMQYDSDSINSTALIFEGHLNTKSK